MIWFLVDNGHGQLFCHEAVFTREADVELFKTQYRKFGGRVLAVVRLKD